ncbi:hypothetical protein PT7_0223 [Pusillimonas sp. T7-7]|uniref:hypothetical protein n=1 Tax=Pusillimonas sp. (strain T7-7) TaxID=1007105 RepID=UPI0002084996|nr:hypothetical protein [Pusillimonas sp. T7-7]AEC18763.1 hypothetical protein PT7_0223 [Pusillimonas sp. T7-7]
MNDDSIPEHELAESTECTQYPRVVRIFSGVAIEGKEITVRLVSSAYGLIGVDVIAHTVLTGYDRDCKLNYPEANTEFHFADIRLKGGILECMSAETKVPFFREGFTVVLEPGMVARIIKYKPLLAKVAVVAAAVERRYSQLIGKTP